MKKVVVIFFITAIIIGCATTTKIVDRSGTELWGQNCGRCHNSPPSSTYSADQWEVLVFHMKTRALITDVEAKKIAAFLQSSN